MASKKPGPDPAPNPEPAPGRFAFDGLERTFHEKARLGILTSLVAHPKGLVFSDLKDLCALTDGNLSRHLQVLHDAGLVEVWKGYAHNRPQTLCRMTDEGRTRFLDYINVLESVVGDALEASKAERPAVGKPAEGWSLA
jgi:DNA-binding MarR family transcriptional regulator